jgi:TP901 family phage tail tape measure protein
MAGAANAGEVRARLILDNSNFRQNMQQAQSDMEGFKAKSADVGKGVDKIKEGATVMGGAVVAVIGASVKAASDFQSSMSRLSAMSNANSTQYDQMKAAALEWGAKTKYSATEAADAMTNLSMAGFTVQQSVDGLPAVLSMAAAGNLDLGKAAEIAGNAMNVFGLKATDLGHVSDVLAKAANTSNADISDLAESLKYAGPVAKGLGLSLEDTSAALALMSNSGIKGSEAGTSLRASLLALNNPVGQTKKAMKELHLSVEDAHGGLLPLPQLLDSVKASMQGMNSAQQTGIAAMLVGREAASGFVTLLNAGGTGLTNFADGLRNSTGAAQKMAQTMQDNLAGSWENFTGSLENFGIQLGSQFLPMLQSLVSKGTDFLNFLGTIDPAVINTALAVAGVTSALALLGVGVFKAIEAFKVFQAVFIASPWGLAITGLALLGGAIAGYVISQKEANTVSLDHFNSLNKQQQGLENVTNAFDQLQAKNKLSNDEMLRYVDLQAELNNTTDPERIKTLSGAMELLRQKSGLSKDEMSHLVQANKDLIDQAPNTQVAVSKTGQAFATSSKEAHALNNELQRQKLLELQIQEAKVANAVDGHIATYQKQIKDVNDGLDQRNAKLQNIYRIQQEAGILDAREVAAQKLKGEAKTRELGDIKAARVINEIELGTAQKQYNEANLIYLQRRQGLQAASDTLTKDKEVYAAINKNLLASIGLTAEQGKEKKAVDDAIKAEQTKADKIAESAGGVDKLKGKQKEAYDEVQSTIKKYQDVSTQIADNATKQAGTNRKIQDGTDNADKLHKTLSKDVTKHVKFSGDGLTLAQKIDDELGKPVQKTVSIIGKVASAVQRFFQSTGDDGAGMTKRHSGGTLPRYHSGGSPNFDAPRADEIDVRLLRNEMVLTAQQQANLFSMIKSLSPQTLSSVVREQPQSQQDAQPININVAQLQVREEADVKRIAEELEKLAQRRQRSRGEY